MKVLLPGGAWNPALKYPRNLPCPCDSGKKFKHCHLPHLPRAVSTEEAKDIKPGIDYVKGLK
jgi:hypothetical protein